MRGLTAIVTRADPEALHAALTLTAAAAALGGRARVYLHEDAVALLGALDDATGDRNRLAHGMPTLAKLLADGPGLGIELIACQSGLALAGMDVAALPDGCVVNGLIGLLASVGEDSLLTL